MSEIVNVECRLERLLFRLLDGCAMFALFVMMLLISVDVIARYFFSHSISVFFTLTQSYLMVAVVFLGMASVFRYGGHIRFTLASSRMPPLARCINEIFINLAVGVFFAVIAYEGALQTGASFVEGRHTGGAISLPMWLSYVWVPIGGILVCLVCLLRVAAGFRDLGRGG